MNWNVVAEILPSLEQLGASLAEVLPRVVAALLILVVGWLVAVALRALVRRLFRELGDRFRTTPARAAWREMDVQGTGDFVAKGVFWLVVLAAVMVGTEALGLSILSTWLGAVASYLPRIVVAMVVVFAGIAGARFAANAVRRATARIAPRQASHLARLAQGAVLVVAVLIAASQLGLDVSLLTAVFLIVLGASLAGAALAFGLGARAVIANILAMHYVQKSYRVGERIRVGADEGRIVRTTATAVFLEGDDGELAIPGHLFSDDRCLRLGERSDVARG